MEIFPRTKRTKERRALYGTIVAVLVLLVALTAILGRRSKLDKDQEWTEIDYASLPEVDLLRRYVRIDTTSDHGSELAGAEFLAGELTKIGLEPTVERLGESKANVWAFLEGERPEALVLHSHIDVFPIRKPEKWDFDPFSATIDKAWLYGRGVFDMKSVTIVQLLALKHLIEQGRKPHRSVLFLATGSEETGSELGTRWILDAHPELRDRFWAVLTEGGIVEPVNRHEFKFWGIEFTQKRFATIEFCSDSLDELAAAREALVRHSQARFAPVVTPEVETFFNGYADTRTNPHYREVLRNPHRLRHRAAEFLRLPFYLLTMLRNELVVFHPEADPSGGFRMVAKLHLLPGQNLDQALAELLPEWATHGLHYQVSPPKGAVAGSPIDTPIFESLAKAVSATYPGAPVGPYFLSLSSTDSQFFRTAGVPAYGFSPFLIFSTDTFRVDGPNERMSLPGYMSGFEIYRSAVERLVALRAESASSP